MNENKKPWRGWRATRSPSRPGAASYPSVWRGVGAGLLLLLAAVTPPVHAQSSSAVTVIMAPDRENAELDRRLLLSIYIGRVTIWPDGQPIRVFTLADNHALHQQFCRELLRTYPYVLRTAWDKLVYTGTGFAPITVANEQAMRERVAATPGAIGYVSVGDEDASVASDADRSREAPLKVPSRGEAR